MKGDRGHLPIQQTSLSGGLKVIFIRVGSGPNLVLIPGLFQTIGGLRHLITALSEHFEVICLAVPGFDGSSPLPKYNLKTVSWWFKEVLTALGVRRALFVSVSLGASLIVPFLAGSEEGIASGYVAQEPVTRVRDVGFLWRTLYHLDRLLRKVRLGWLSLLGLWLLRAFMAHGLRLGFARSLLRTRLRVLAQIGDLVSENPIHTLAAQASRRIPTMPVLSGRKTRWLVSAKSIGQVVDSMRSAAKAVLEEAGHFLHGHDQEELAKQIIKFARQRGILDQE